MLSYRHSFHAGNHADVLKHTVQALIIDALKGKDKPFVYHDSHSGAGRYDLQSEHAEKTGEFVDGIGRLWGQDCPQTLHPYLKAVKELNPNGDLRYYPGSPKLAGLMLRAHDRLMMTELHPTDFPRLKQEFGGDRRAQILKADGYQQIKASMPPKERRGMVLIDPPYELKTEYDDLVKGVVEGHKRWATGTFAIWYPVVYRENVDFIERRLKASGIRSILKIEMNVMGDANTHGMTGSGMIVINPPWKLEQQMNDLLPWLTEKLTQGIGARFSVDWIVPE
ncbi:23S rRNA (adenine(2030)-N(6))-methyltransferase RlmJ [Ferrimonas lipolytica]|uniref:Ribosomal RNA large subunit methyltransferase J n=1 Tax=Ferrimonas lipolytica TaxID=2724191 RepID=A0A6H1UGG1_9GAMM|nr:23S rRNA (adenine(2030)-N(6))-methyltransferase RlmJ [Ferrimonas lipolytica]QIZ76882.1 23S rRNA (adenine(2030)-N(6))-methyltransferase RlmJ [Ferrimonas lipolytica]